MSEEAKEHKGDPLRDAEDVMNDKGLQEKTAKHLEKFNALLDDEPAVDSKDEDDSNSDDQEQDSKEQDDQTDNSKDEDDSTSESEDKDKDEDEDKDEDGSKDKEDPPEVDDIPDGHIRAAKGQGWSDEDIADEIKANPDRAKRLFQNAYETSNKVTRQFSAIGRDKAEATRKAAEKPEPEIKDFMTAEEIATAADGDEASATILKAMVVRMKVQDVENAKLRKSLSTGDVEFARSDQKAATARANATADVNVMQTVDNFFSADDMKSYTDFYGVVKTGQDWDDITPRQKEHRIAVLQEADCYKVGNASQGIEVSTATAMEKAHLLVTDSIRETKTVDRIKKSLKKRTKTLRPSDGKRSAKSTDIRKATNTKEAVTNAGQRLAALNKKGWN